MTTALKYTLIGIFGLPVLLLLGLACVFALVPITLDAILRRIAP